MDLVPKMRKSELLREDINNVKEFLRLYNELAAEVAKLPDTYGIISMTTNKLDSIQDPNVLALSDNLAQAAGNIHNALENYGDKVILRGESVNPVINWRMSFSYYPVITPGQIRESCNRLLGKLESSQTKAIRSERSLAGKLARVISFPVEVRDSAGIRSGRTKKFLFGATIFGQIFAAVVAGLLLYILVRAI